MFGLDWTKLIPGGQIEEMARLYGPDAVKFIMRAAAAHHKLQPGERMAILITEHELNGEPTVLALPMALPASLDMNQARKFPFHNLPDFLRTAPLAKWIKDLKDSMKFSEKLDKLRAELVQAAERKDAAKVKALLEQVKAMKDQMPAISRMLDELTDAVANSGAPAQPAPTLETTPPKAGLPPATPAAEKGAEEPATNE